MRSRRQGKEQFLFDLIRELFPQDDCPDLPAAQAGGREAFALMVLIGVLAVIYGLRFGVFFHP